MKFLQSIANGVMLALSYSIVTVAAENSSHPVTVSQNATVTTSTNSEQTQSTTVSIDRADLSQPHILKVQSSGNLQRVTVKINGKSIKSIANNSLELNLAPLMTGGRYEVKISGNSARSDDTISVSFNGKNTNISQQVSGTGTIDQTLVINIQ